MDYKNFKIDCNNLCTLAPKLLEEIASLERFELLNDDSEITVIMKKGGNDVEIQSKVKDVKVGLQNPKMTDIVIWETEMRFKF